MKLLASLAGLLLSVTSVLSQYAPNTVASGHYLERTQASTGVFFMISVDSQTARSLTGHWNLIQAPGFLLGQHPVLVSSTYVTNIQMGPISIKSILEAQVIIPYVDRLADGKTPFSKTLVSFIGNTTKYDFEGIMPPAVSAITADGGYPVYTAIMDPHTSPYDSAAGRQFFTNTQIDVVPKEMNALGVTHAALDFLFHRGSGYSLQTINRALNQPAVLGTTLQCQRTDYRFNEKFANINTMAGTVKLTSPAVPLPLGGGRWADEKTYQTSGFSGTAEMIRYDIEDCETAARNVVVV